MTDIKRVRVTWSGAGVVGPGVSTFYYGATASGFPADLLTFYTAVRALVPDSVQWVIPNSGDTIAVETGRPTGTWSDTGGGNLLATGNSAFVQGTGVRIKWPTNQIINGRRVTGSTFIVPLSSNQFEGSGAILGTALTTLQAAATALATAGIGDRFIWHRPTSVAAANGNVGAVTIAQVPDAVSWLRSRRT